MNNVETEQRSIENLPFTPDAELDSHFKGIQEKVKQKYLDVKTIPGDWSRRGLNTYVKKKPTCKELQDLQGILMGLEMHSPKEVNYWLKAFTTTHEGILVAVTELISKQTPIPTWLLEGRCGLHPKKLQPKAPDHRPITCLNTMYRSITSLVGEYLPLKTLQMDQRGGRPGVMGCTDNMLIDKMILEDAKMKKKNLSMVWTDVINGVINEEDKQTNHKVCRKHNERLENLNNCRYSKWKGTIGANQCQERYLQGDSFVVKLFVLCLDPIAWTIRGYEGYQLRHDRTMKITHLLFVDDLKLYAKSENKISVVTKKVKEMYEDIGMSWAWKSVLLCM